MASLCTRFAEWVRSPFSAVVIFQKQFVGDVTEKMKHQKEKLDRRIREQQQRAIERKLDELEEKYLCCVCHRPGQAREEEEHIYETFSTINVPPTQTIIDAVQEIEDVSSLEEEEQEEYFREHRYRYGEKQLHQEKKKYNIDYDSNQDDVDEYSTAENVKRKKSRVGKTSEFNKEHIIMAKRQPDNSQLFATEKGQYKAGQRNAHYEHNDDSCHARPEEEANNSNIVIHDDDGNIKNSDRYNHHATTSMSSNDKINFSVNRRSKAANSPHTNIAPQDVIDPSMVSRRDIQHMLYKIRHAILNKEAHVKRKAAVVHRDRGLMKIDETEIDLFSLFFQRSVHGYLCASCYTSARRRLDTLTQQVQLILFRANHPLLRKVSKIEMEEELRRGRATLPALLIGPPSLSSFEPEIDEHKQEEEQEEEEEKEEVPIAEQRIDVDDNNVNCWEYRSGKFHKHKRSSCHDEQNSTLTLKNVYDDINNNREWQEHNSHASRKITPTTFNNSTMHQNHHAMHNVEYVECRNNTTSSSSSGGDNIDNYENNVNGNSMSMGQLTDSVIYALRSYVKCGVCERRYSCFFVRASVLFICQFCCARDRFYRDHAICINDELMPLDCVHLLTDLSYYYYRIHHDQQHKHNNYHHQEEQEQQNSSLEVNMSPTEMKKTTETDLFGPVNEDNLFECLPPLNNNTTSVNIVPVYDDTLESDDPRNIVGQTTVSLFAGRKLEPAATSSSSTRHIDLFAEHVNQNLHQMNNNSGFITSAESINNNNNIDTIQSSISNDQDNIKDSKHNHHVLDDLFK